MNGCDHAVRGNPRIESSTLGGGKESTGHQREGFKSECPRCGARRIDSQIGLEKTPEEYVAKMVAVFREVRRVLRKDGTLWLNLGDSYASGGEHSNNNGEGASTMGWPGQRQETLNKAAKMTLPRVEHGLKPKDLCGIPWRVAFALQADGWWLRSDIIWAKPNPMPESVTDRPTKSHEYLFLLTKSANYFYDAEAIKEPGEYCGLQLGIVRGLKVRAEAMGRKPSGNEMPGADALAPTLRNKRSVWTVATAPYPEAHFATYPPDLIKPCILAGTSAKGCCAKCGAPWERVVEKSERPDVECADHDLHGRLKSSGDIATTRMVGGQYQKWLNQNPDKTLGWKPTCKCLQTITHHDKLVSSFPYPTVPCTLLDPFAGSGTTGMVALELGRKAVLIELNPAYVKLIEQRCDVTPGLQLA